MRALWSDLMYGLRVQSRNRSTTLVAVAVLALGVAGNNVAFSLVNAFFLRPLPVTAPEQLVRIYTSESGGYQHFTVSFDDVERIRDYTSVFTAVMAEAPLPLSLQVEGASERVWGELVTADYFSQLGIRPAAGRFFAPDEDGRSGRASVAVLGYALWQRRFGAAREAVGRTMVLNRQVVTVVGVAPSSFGGMNLGLVPDLWLPATMTPQVVPRASGSRGYFVTGRLAPGRTLGDARAALDLLSRQLRREFPDARRTKVFTVLPEAEGRVHPMARRGLMGFSAVLAGVAALLLVLACVNVAGLLLVRTTTRRKEIGVRLALGAGRGRILRQFLAEAALLSAAATSLGVALAWFATHLMSLIHLPVDAPLAFDFGQDARVLGFSGLVAGLVIGLVGLAPAFDAARSDVVSLLKDGGAGSGSRRSRLRSALVALQIALSTLLLVGGGLFLRSLQNARQVDVGFDPEGAVAAAVDLGLQGYSADEALGFWRRLFDQLGALPGVEALSLASRVPFELNITTVAVAPEGYAIPPSGSWPVTDFAVIGAGYFATMRIPVLEGREFDRRDERPEAGVAIVNDVFARRFWPGRSAVGQRLRTSFARLEVIGVARQAKRLTLGEEAKPFVYFPHDPHDVRPMTILVRGAGDPQGLLERVRATIRALDPRLPVYNAETLSRRVSVALAPARWGAGVLNAVGLAALLLASVGLHGTLAQMVARRTREIGVRRVLGAQGNDIVRLIAGRTVALVAGGLALGLALGLAAARLLSSQLYGVGAVDPVAFALAPLGLALSALLAAWVPLRRALRVDPAEALRYE